jgi:hypothetical protein
MVPAAIRMRCSTRLVLGCAPAALHAAQGFGGHQENLRRVLHRRLEASEVAFFEDPVD